VGRVAPLPILLPHLRGCKLWSQRKGGFYDERHLPGALESALDEASWVGSSGGIAVLVIFSVLSFRFLVVE
jgi:hypothetical protein